MSSKRRSPPLRGRAPDRSSSSTTNASCKTSASTATTIHLRTPPHTRTALHALDAQVDEVVKAGRAVLAADLFTFDGSLAKGRRMVGDLSKLMLRAYNAEADNCVRSLRSGNVSTATKRLDSAVAAIEKLGTIMEMRINPDYHALRVSELELTADYQMKVQEERERAREQRELLREQRRAEAELAAERERLEKERLHYMTALESLRAKGDVAAVAELSGRLADIEQAISPTTTASPTSGPDMCTSSPTSAPSGQTLSKSG